eukprot:2863388-Prymnesium_polylepis.2
MADGRGKGCIAGEHFSPCHNPRLSVQSGAQGAPARYGWAVANGRAAELVHDEPERCGRVEESRVRQRGVRAARHANTKSVTGGRGKGARQCGALLAPPPLHSQSFAVCANPLHGMD